MADSKPFTREVTTMTMKDPRNKIQVPGLEVDPNDPTILYKHAEAFIENVGLRPNPDAIDQLVRAFVPALRIMCEREHDPNGGTWRESGWKPLLHEIMKKSGRLRYRSWRNDNKDTDSPPDMINYLGFLMRAWLDSVDKWGEWGEPK